MNQTLAFLFVDIQMAHIKNTGKKLDTLLMKEMSFILCC
jgi:hypothetical protein